MAAKTVAAAIQLAPQLRVIINFSVEDDHGAAVSAHHGLIAAGEIDDLQPHGAERNPRRLVDPLLVRAAVNQRGGNPLDEIGVGRALRMRKPGNAAHATIIADFTPAVYTRTIALHAGNRPIRAAARLRHPVRGGPGGATRPAIALRPGAAGNGRAGGRRTLLPFAD